VKQSRAAREPLATLPKRIHRVRDRSLAHRTERFRERGDLDVAGRATYAHAHQPRPTTMLLAPLAAVVLLAASVATFAPLAAAPAARRGTVRRAVDGGGGSDKAGAPKLPKGAWRPKQSLGQNYLTDPNYIDKIVRAFSRGHAGNHVVELGPGLGALTRPLAMQFPNMTAIEIDQRAVEALEGKFPGVNVVRSDVLQVDYTALAETVGGGKPLHLVGNLPYHITSQILFQLVEDGARGAVDRCIFTMQKEVADRLVAPHNCKDYGILSVVFQLCVPPPLPLPLPLPLLPLPPPSSPPPPPAARYASPRMEFKIPPTAFYPVPKVTSAVVQLDFTGALADPPPIDYAPLRAVVKMAFNQRRKMLRQALKGMLRGQDLPERWARRRAEQLPPAEFVELTQWLLDECGESFFKIKEAETPTRRKRQDRRLKEEGRERVVYAEADLGGITGRTRAEQEQGL